MNDEAWKKRLGQMGIAIGIFKSTLIQASCIRPHRRTNEPGVSSIFSAKASSLWSGWVKVPTWRLVGVGACNVGTEICDQNFGWQIITMYQVTVLVPPRAELRSLKCHIHMYNTASDSKQTEILNFVRAEIWSKRRMVDGCKNELFSMKHLWNSIEMELWTTVYMYYGL